MSAFKKTTIEIIDVPFLPKLPSGAPPLLDNTSLAYRLGIQTYTLTHYVKTRNAQYKTFTIPKKSGGKRTIHAPKERLKWIQERILEKVINPVAVGNHIGAYVKERSTAFSAIQHTNKNVLIILDLENFFGSTRRSWVRKMFTDEFGYSHRVASYLADLVTVPFVDVSGETRHIVPQGSPTSGAICNWVGINRFDRALLHLCKSLGYIYTRYADDLAFSSAAPQSPDQIRAFIRAVYKIISKAGYRINQKKLRVLRKGKQQRLLGMVVNEKTNIIKKDYKNLRARIHDCAVNGIESVATKMKLTPAQLHNQISGMLSYYHSVNPTKAALLKAKFQPVSLSFTTKTTTQ